MRMWPLLYQCNVWLFQTLTIFPTLSYCIFHGLITCLFCILCDHWSSPSPLSAPGLAPAQAKPAARQWQIKRSELSVFKAAPQQIKAVCLCSARCSGKERPFSHIAFHCKSPWQHEQASRKTWPLLQHQLHCLLPLSSKPHFGESCAIKIAGKKSLCINPAQSPQQHLKLSKQRIFCLQVSNSQGQISISLLNLISWAVIYLQNRAD